MPEEIRFYTDEHVSKAIVRGLRERGVDVVSASEAGMRGASDPHHLTRARSEGRVIFTHDTDFLRLHAAGAEHAGIVYAQAGTSVGRIVYGLLLIYQVLHAAEMKGHVEFV
ncbi:MAG: DUF5615 family PIN-like protein [Chloroflexi bacterium]|nr:DUF5615 family PIN-like protein [Chloroflexota bacterium]